MNPKHVRWIAAIVAALMLAFVAFWTAARTQPQRRAPFNQPEAPSPAVADAPGLTELPPEQWTQRIIDLQRSRAWPQLRRELDELRRENRAAFDRNALGYLMARILIEMGELDAAERELAPFLAAESPFAALAPHHRIEIEVARGNDEAAAKLREAYIFEVPDSVWRSEEIETQLTYLSAADPAGLLRFAARLRPEAPTALRRELDSLSAAAMMQLERQAEARELAWRVLRGGTGDDPGERALGILDTPAEIRTMTGEQLVILGDTARSHRHFDRAIELYGLARERNARPAADLLFAIGRSHFGAEEFEDAETAYLSGAGSAQSAEQRATLFFHAGRAAQLMGEDDRAVRHMTRAIAVRGNFGATSAALTQRMRTRARGGDLDGARNDLRLLERILSRSEGRVEAGVHFATYLLAAGRPEEALAELDRVPLSLADVWAESEMDYWRGRALEESDPAGAVARYLETMQYAVPTHFAFLARARLRLPPLNAALEARIGEARSARDAAVSAGEWQTARRHGTDALLLSGIAEDREALRKIYTELPAYRRVLELEPEPLPAYPLPRDAERADLLMAMGLFDEATPEIAERWSVRSMEDALTRSQAMNLAAASRDSIYAVEVMMRSVPDDYVQELLPRRVRELLYPRYFVRLIERDAARFGADPRLVLSIMREESRFNPRAKSIAAARGLLQFIITTARQIGASLGLVDLQSSDLYDPRTIIQLGARYVADLLEEFDGDRYRAAAAYNAGPYQTRLWSRMQPAPGEDYFLTTVNFSETKHYVRKVMNSYQRYGEIYEEAPVTGGIPAEP